MFHSFIFIVIFRKYWMILLAIRAFSIVSTIFRHMISVFFYYIFRIPGIVRNTSWSAYISDTWNISTDWICIDQMTRLWIQFLFHLGLRDFKILNICEHLNLLITHFLCLSSYTLWPRVFLRLYLFSRTRTSLYFKYQHFMRSMYSTVPNDRAMI